MRPNTKFKLWSADRTIPPAITTGEYADAWDLLDCAPRGWVQVEQGGKIVLANLAHVKYIEAV